MVDRRTVLAGGAAMAVVTGNFSSRAMAQATTHTVGEMTVRVLSDGHMMVGLDRFAAKPDDAAAFKAAVGDLAATPKFEVNVTLIEHAGKRILIDAGAGGTWVDTAGKLGDALTAAGIDPASIDHVALTHAHPDHLWGVIDDFDNSLRFPKATYSLPNAEFEFWMTPGVAEKAGAADGVIAGARRVLKVIEAKLKRVGAEGPFLPGLAYLDAKGHTPGQCAVLASSGGAHALIATDTIFHPVVSLRHPDWQPAQDMDGAVAAQSRRKMLDIAAARKALVIAYHVAGVGRVEKTGAAYAWVAA